MTNGHEPAAAALHVVALGASTPVGRDSWSSAAAVRAGISSFAQHHFMVDRTGKPMSVAEASWLDPSMTGRERFDALLYPAIEQVCGAGVQHALSRFRVALAIGLPAARPGLPPDLESDLRSSFSRRFNDGFVATATFATGHAAGLMAMQASAQKIREHVFDACVVAGVDSYLMPETLEWLDDTDRLHGSGTPGNPWGFVPGEAAGAVLLACDDFVKQVGIAPLASVLGVGIAVERNRAYTPTVCVGEGLTAAFRAGLADLPLEKKVTDIFCDMNGEPYRADEFGFASLRTKPAFLDPSDFVAAADCWGDVSAASAPLGLVLSVIAGRKGYSRGRHALVWASSESGERGAALLDLL